MMAAKKVTKSTTSEAAESQEQAGAAFDERQQAFLNLLGHGLQTGSVSSSAYAKVKRVSIGDGDAKYYTVWTGVSNAMQKQLAGMNFDDLMNFAERGKLRNFNDEQFQVITSTILNSAQPE